MMEKCPLDIQEISIKRIQEPPHCESCICFEDKIETEHKFKISPHCILEQHLRHVPQSSIPDCFSEHHHLESLQCPGFEKFIDSPPPKNLHHQKFHACCNSDFMKLKLFLWHLDASLLDDYVKRISENLDIDGYKRLFRELWDRKKQFKDTILSSRCFSELPSICHACFLEDLCCYHDFCDLEKKVDQVQHEFPKNKCNCGSKGNVAPFIQTSTQKVMPEKTPGSDESLDLKTMELLQKIFASDDSLMSSGKQSTENKSASDDTLLSKRKASTDRPSLSDGSEASKESQSMKNESVNEDSQEDKLQAEASKDNDLQETKDKEKYPVFSSNRNSVL
ncbi:uncharacterized protein LOC118181630 [Stegodyphus dumicola]|uniref:uncharacterized protein LOC118181630 n=1 Tax=Stegodyphus dumicola TaxID=202533 RepID=UPI0015AA8A63|nr:uncharacterized protein LOC118181630 [Stegodyphus dumicola]